MPSGSVRFADRIQLTAAKFREIEEINRDVNTSVAPVTDLELYGKPEVWTYPAQQGRLRGLRAAQAPHADRARLS